MQQCKKCYKWYGTKREDRLKKKFCDECFDSMGLKHLIDFENKCSVYDDGIYQCSVQKDESKTILKGGTKFEDDNK